MRSRFRRLLLAPIVLALVLGVPGTAAARGSLGSVYATPKSLSFGKVAVGTSSAPQSFWVVNDTKAALIVTSLASSGAGFTMLDYLTASSCFDYVVNGWVLYPGQTCGLGAQFDPQVSGRQTASIGLTFSDGARTFSITEALSGTGY